MFSSFSFYGSMKPVRDYWLGCLPLPGAAIAPGADFLRAPHAHCARQFGRRPVIVRRQSEGDVRRTMRRANLVPRWCVWLLGQLHRSASEIRPGWLLPKCTHSDTL